MSANSGGCLGKSGMARCTEALHFGGLPGRGGALRWQRAVWHGQRGTKKVGDGTAKGTPASRREALRAGRKSRSDHTQAGQPKWPGPRNLPVGGWRSFVVQASSLRLGRLGTRYAKMALLRPNRTKMNNRQSNGETGAFRQPGWLHHNLAQPVAARTRSGCGASFVVQASSLRLGRLGAGYAEMALLRPNRTKMNNRRSNRSGNRRSRRQDADGGRLGSPALQPRTIPFLRLDPRSGITFEIPDFIRPNRTNFARGGNPTRLLPLNPQQRDRLPPAALWVRSGERIGAVSEDRAGAAAGGAINPQSGFLLSRGKSAGGYPTKSDQICIPWNRASIAARKS